MKLESQQRHSKSKGGQIQVHAQTASELQCQQSNHSYHKLTYNIQPDSSNCFNNKNQWLELCSIKET